MLAVTGFVSHWAYYPELTGNATVNPGSDIPVLFHFPGSWPSWSYALNQGTHVTLGLMTLPFILAKLWSVMPKLFERPVVRNFAGALERISLLLLVGSVLLEFATGILDIDSYYRLPVDFRTFTTTALGCSSRCLCSTFASSSPRSAAPIANAEF